MTLRDMQPIIEKSRELNDALALTPSQAASHAVRYVALKDSNRITADGDVLTEKEYDGEVSALRAMLMDYIERNEPIAIEGVGLLRIQPRRNTSYDLAAIAKHDPALFARLLELGCLTVNNALAGQQAKAGNLMGLSKWAINGETPALIVERER